MASELEKLALIVDHAARIERMTDKRLTNTLANRADCLREDLEDWIEDRLREVSDEKEKGGT